MGNEGSCGGKALPTTCVHLYEECHYTHPCCYYYYYLQNINQQLGHRHLESAQNNQQWNHWFPHAAISAQPGSSLSEPGFILL